MRVWLLFPVLALAGCQDKPTTNTVSAENMTEAQPQPVSDGTPYVDAIKADLGPDYRLGENARFTTALTDLNGDGRDEALVYLVDQGVCGSGGCNLYVLTDNGENVWSVDSKMTVSRPPIYRLPTRTNGWADLGVTVSGGGLMRMVMKVPRTAHGYASNPTVPPAISIDPGNA
jgi:hypothetical protein